MAAEERTEQATYQKLRQARQKGQVSKSVDITATAGILVCLVTIVFLAKQIGLQMMTMMESVFHIAPNISSDSNTWLIGRLFQTYLFAVMPVLMMAMVVGVLLNIVQTRGVFSFHPLKPDIQKMNPIKGFKKLISMKSLFELVKSLLRLSSISILAYLIFYDEVIYLVDIMNYSISDTFERVSHLIVKTIAFFLLVMLPFTAFDFFFQRWSFSKEMRMTKKEVKDEYKNQEGDPEIKSKRRKLQKEMRGKVQSLSNVPSSDVVITNPTFIAIALKYDSSKMVAPQVVSKGKGSLAKKIRDIASDNDVLMCTNIPLARAIYKDVKINSEIHPEHYDQVAEIYRWYFKMNKNNSVIQGK